LDVKSKYVELKVEIGVRRAAAAMSRRSVRPCWVPRLSTRASTALYVLLHLLLGFTKPETDASFASEFVHLVLREPIPKAPYTLAVCAIVNNEAAYLPEWIVYHYIIGFQHFTVKGGRAVGAAAGGHGGGDGGRRTRGGVHRRKVRAVGH
jgi:hypothetical protein